LLEYDKQFRQEDVMGTGGSGTLFHATLLEPSLISKWGSTAVIKQMKSLFNLFSPFPFASPLNNCLDL